MPKDRAEVVKLIEALEDAGYEPKSYSGRGMFGKCCVSVHDVSGWDLAKALFDETFDGAFSNLPEPRQDQLGRGIVLYWPSYEWPKDDNTVPEKDGARDPRNDRPNTDGE